jgi:hypothetical protein
MLDAGQTERQGRLGIGEVRGPDPAGSDALRWALANVKHALDRWGRELERATDAVIHDSPATPEFLEREREAWHHYTQATARLRREIRWHRYRLEEVSRDDGPGSPRQALA